MRVVAHLLSFTFRMAKPSEPNFPATFWRTLTRIDKSKINGIWMASRNALAIALPLAVGIGIGNPLAGIAVATGALNVSYSDGRDPYSHRARRMLFWSFLGAVAVFLGSVTGNYHVLAICVAAAWALTAGLLVAISTRAGDLGLNTLVTLIVYGARGAMSPKGAVEAGLLVLGGGILQTALALLFWPVRRYQPERQAVGKVYRDLARQVEERGDELLAAPLKQPEADVQDTLSALGRDHSLEGERLRLLFDQADRLRFSIYVVQRLRVAAGSKDNQLPIQNESVADFLSQILHLSAGILSDIGDSLASDHAFPQLRLRLEQLKDLVAIAHTAEEQEHSRFAEEIAAAVDVLAGQFRVVQQLAEHTTTAGAEEFARGELAPPWRLQLGNWLATLRANLNLGSSAFRHGIRLSVCVAIAEAIGSSINIQRNYWLAMTVAVVLKPDFTTTISRGVLRLCGTFAGLVLATILFHALPPSALTQLVLVGLFTFILRYVGSANYGIFSVAISGLIVFLIAAAGIAPAEVVVERAVNTAAGGVFALVAYVLWPTWARKGVADALATMLDRSRDYFQAVFQRFTRSDHEAEKLLDQTRHAWRQARSDAEAAVDRVSSEPGVNATQIDLLNSILASSHSVVYAVMGIEADVVQRPSCPLPSTLQAFAHDVEFTLYFLSAALHGSSAPEESFPRLRKAHRLLLEAPPTPGSYEVDEFVVEAADRLTVGLNTLREQILHYLGQPEHAS